MRESKVTKARASAFSKKHRTPARSSRRGRIRLLPRKPKVEKRAPAPHLFVFLVAKSSNASPSAQPEAAPPSFEVAMERLETIVEAMEAGDVPLAELLTKYEEGAKLIAHCEARLKTAELKIEQLKRQRDGSVRLEPFAASETPESA